MIRLLMGCFGGFLLAFPLLAGASPASEARARLADETVTSDYLKATLEAEVRFGYELSAQILGRYRLVEDPALLRYVNLVGRKVARNSSRPGLDYHFGVLDSDRVNAFAAAGGYVFITRGALDYMTDEAELAGVLAHEIAHVNRKHIVEELDIRAKEGTVTGGLARLVGGSSGAVQNLYGQALDQAATILFEKGRKRKDELEADRDGTFLLARSGYDPGGLRRYLARVASEAPESRTADRRRTHPPFADRIERLNGFLEEEGVDGIQGQDFERRFIQQAHKADQG